MNYMQIFRVALPVILANITVPLLGAVDIAMLGHRHDTHLLAAISIATMIFDLLFWGFSFLRMTTTGLVAQAPSDKATIHRALLLAFSLGMLLMLFSQPILQLMMRLFQTNASLKAYIADYYHIRILAAIPTLLSYVSTGYLFGLKNTRASLVLVLLTNIIAILLDILLVFHFQWGIKGLAIANVIAVSSTQILTLYYLQQTYQIFSNINIKQLFCPGALKKLMKINSDVLIRSLSLLLTFTYFTRLGSKMGPTIVASNAILMNLNHLMAYTLDGFTISLEAFVGQAIGEKNKTLLKQSLKACGVVCVSGALCFSLLFYLFGRELITLMTSIKAVQDHCLTLLPWLIGLPIIAIGSYILDGCYIGAVWTKDMRNSMLIALSGFVLSTYLFQSLQAHGLWLAFYIFMLLRLIFLWLPLDKNLKATHWKEASATVNDE